MKRVALVLLLALTFVTVTGHASVLDAVIALVFGVLIMVATPGARSPVRALERPSGLLRFLFGVGRELVKGAATMLWVLLGGRTWRTLGMVELPLGERTSAGVAVSSWVTTAGPGSIVVDIDEHAGLMLVNVIDASNPDEVRRDHERFYRRFQTPALP